MAISDALRERTLERLRERLRAQYPQDRIILFLDSRESPANPGRTIVAIIPPSSPWHELLPPEQVAEIFDRDGSN